MHISKGALHNCTKNTLQLPSKEAIFIYRKINGEYDLKECVSFIMMQYTYLLQEHFKSGHPVRIHYIHLNHILYKF